MTLASPECQEMNGQVEVTRRTLRTITKSLMVHARFLEAYIHFEFMFMTDHIVLVLPISDLIKKGIELTTPFQLTTGTKP